METPAAAWLGPSALVPHAESDLSAGIPALAGAQQPSVSAPTRGGALGSMPPPVPSFSNARLESGDTFMPAPSYTATDGTAGTLGQGLDWSWPPMEPEDMAMAEIAFDRQMNVPRNGWLWMGRFMDFLEVVDGIPKSAFVPF